MTPMRFFIALLFSTFVTATQLCDGMCEYYRLEVDRLRLLLQLDASALREHYQGQMTQMQNDHEEQISDLSCKLDAAHATIHMQKMIIARIVKDEKKKDIGLEHS